MKSDEARHLPLQAETIRSFVVEACGGEREIVLQMVDFFLHSAENLHKEMESGLAAKDFATVRRAAHSLKSSSRMFSAETLSSLCAETEELATKREGDALALLLPPIRAELKWLASELPAFCAGLTA
jgi:HPt (histidine-containing phosphotransfer) domain-containing protein